MSKRALHNALFTAEFTHNVKLAAEMLKLLLGKEKAARLNFRTLKFETTVFTDAEGNERRADALISVMTKDGRRVLFLIEHKSTQSRSIFPQLLSYQTVIYADTHDEVVPLVISTAKSRWSLPRSFRATSNDICGEVSLNFGYLLFDFAAHTVEALKSAFPSSHPYLLGMRSLQQLNKEAIAAFFVGSLALPAAARLRLMGQVTDCLVESRENFSAGMLEEIEAGCIKRVKDRLMRTVKIGQEGWLERGFKRGLAEGKAEGLVEGKAEGEAEGLAKGKAEGEAEGLAKGKAEVALRMLEEGVSIEVIRRTTGLKRNDLTKLKKKRA